MGAEDPLQEEHGCLVLFSERLFFPAVAALCDEDLPCAGLVDEADAPGTVSDTGWETLAVVKGKV